MGGIQHSADTAHTQLPKWGRSLWKWSGCQAKSRGQLCKAVGIFMQRVPTTLLKSPPKTGAESGKGIENGVFENNFWKCNILLILWEAHTMNSDHIHHAPTPTALNPQHLPISCNFNVLLCFQPFESSLCYPYTSGCGAFHWSTVDLMLGP